MMSVKSINLLIIEDRVRDAELVLHLLKKTNYKINATRIDNEQSYLEELDKSPDIIISDYSLPSFTGIDALRILKSKNLDIPFILVSGTIGEELAVEAMQLGASDYIIKGRMDRLPMAVKRELKDATIRKKLKQSDENYKNLVELSPEPIYILCEDQFLFCNRATREYFGSTTNLLTLKSFSELVSSNSIHDVKEFLTEVLLKNTSLTSNVIEFITLDSQVKNAELSAAPVKYSNKNAIQIISRDVTLQTQALMELKDKNEQLRNFIETNKKLKFADLMRSKFIANMSHELRTPLNAIIGFSEILKDGMAGSLNAKQAEYCGNISKSGQYLLSLINDILDVSKVEAGKMELEISEIDLDHFFKDCLSLFKDKSILNKINLIPDIDENIGKGKYDEKKLKQAICNLIANGIKFTPDGGDLYFSANIKNNKLIIKIKDTGPGISPQNYKKIFLPFEQGGKTKLANRDKGTGLGLMISKHFVELHGGSIFVKSEENVGTTFTISLPHEFPETHRERVEQMAKMPFALVIEDDPLAADLVSIQLSELGIEVIWVKSAEEALSASYPIPPLFIILDILLPGMSGIDFMNTVSEHSDLKNVPIVIVSVIAQECKSTIVGAIDVLQKPISREALSNTILNFVKKKNLQGKVHILIADDDPSSIKIIKQSLSNFSCDITCASDGYETLSLIQEHQPDILILDLVMPNLDGFGVIENLTRENSNNDISIIVLTSKSLSQSEQMFLKGNALNILHKDAFNKEMFQKVIKKILIH